MDPFLGEIRMVGFGWVPQGWAACNGAILSVAQYSALYSLLGTQFGGNGTTNFALPDLRGRVPINQGSGPGLQPVVMGQMAGEQSVTLTTAQIPAHSHMVAPAASSGDATVADPTGAVPANNGNSAYADAGTATGVMAPAQCSAAGNNMPHDNMPPYTGVNFIIALQGVYPSRQ